MSRIISEIARNKFLNGQKFSSKNTKVNFEELKDGKNICLYLHDNRIARINPEGVLFINTCGWATNTTKERLNALPRVSIYQKNYKWFLNGEQWDGKEIKIGLIK